MAEIKGIISQIIGPVVDVHFDDVKSMPAIYDALKVQREDGRTLIIEVQQHIGEDTVRCVAMDSTDGLKRGIEAISTGEPIEMPVGNMIRGRVLNVMGDAIDGARLSRNPLCLYIVSLRSLRILPRHRKCCLPALKSSTFLSRI